MYINAFKELRIKNKSYTQYCWKWVLAHAIICNEDAIFTLLQLFWKYTFDILKRAIKVFGPEKFTGTSTLKLDKYFALHFTTFEEQHTHTHTYVQSMVEGRMLQIKSNIMHANSSFRLSKSENFISEQASKMKRKKTRQKQYCLYETEFIQIHLVFPFHFVYIYKVIKCLHTKLKMN